MEGERARELIQDRASEALKGSKKSRRARLLLGSVVAGK